MTKQLDGLLQFPVDAQRSSLFCCLASVLLHRMGYTEETPFFCGKFQRICVKCGSCQKTNLQKHHLSIYHHLVTVTGCAFLWEDKAVGDPFTAVYRADRFSETAQDRLSLSLQAYGYGYEAFDKSISEAVLFDKIRESVDRNQPALIKLGGGDVWAVVTGYDAEKRQPYLMKMNHTPKFYKEWYEKLRSIVFLTDTSEKAVSAEALLQNMYRHLTTGSREKLLQKILLKLKTEPDGRKLGLWLNKMNGLIIENRWHASECYLHSFLPVMSNEESRNALKTASKLHLHFHDQVWKIWDLLGISSRTGYCLPDNIAELLSDSAVRDALSALYQELFALDREAAKCIQKCLEVEYRH